MLLRAGCSCTFKLAKNINKYVPFACNFCNPLYPSIFQKNKSLNKLNSQRVLICHLCLYVLIYMNDPILSALCFYYFFFRDYATFQYQLTCKALAYTRSNIKLKITYHITNVCTFSQVEKQCLAYVINFCPHELLN